eukprot:g785.t1
MSDADCSDDDGMEVPGIGASVVAGEVRRLSGDIVRRVSDAARKMSSSSKRDDDDDDLDAAFDDDDDIDLGGREHGCSPGQLKRRPIPLCIKLVIVLLFGSALVMVLVGMGGSAQQPRHSPAAINRDDATGSGRNVPVDSGGDADDALFDARGGNAPPTESQHQPTSAEVVQQDSRAARAITDMQFEQQQRGEAVQLSCRSTGNLHLLGQIEDGKGAKILCPQGCRDSDWVQKHSEIVWGDKDGYADVSLVCYAAQHSTGVDGGEFFVSIGKSTNFASQTRNNITTTAHDGESRSFRVKLLNSLADIERIRQEKHKAELEANAMVPPAELRARFLHVLRTIPQGLAAIRFFKIAVSEAPVVKLFHEFDKIDKARSGYVERAQFLAEAQNEKREHGAKLDDYWQRYDVNAFQDMDQNGDGRLDKQEYQAGYYGFELALSQIITELDTDHNNKISRKEMDVLRTSTVMELLSFGRYVSRSGSEEGEL